MKFAGSMLALSLSASSCAETARAYAHAAAARARTVVAAVQPENPGCTTGPDVAPGAGPLPPLDLSTMRLWNYAGTWMASNWASQGPIPYRYDHVQRSKRSAVLVLDDAGAPQLKAYGGNPSKTSGFWEADVTLPKLRDGLVVAPLWLYNEKSREEVDIEFTGRTGLQLTLHTYPGGVHTTDACKVFDGRDLSGERHRFAIALDEGAGIAEVFVDNHSVARFDREKTKGFPTTDLKPIIEMWAADPNNAGFVGWVGRWQPLAAGEKLEMTVWGYRYAPAAPRKPAS